MKKTAKIFTRSVKFYLSLLIISTGLILYGTLFPVDYEISKTLLGYDKVIHFLMFGAWSFFYGIIRFLKENYTLFPVFITGSLFGLAIEILQYFLPTNRSAEFFDFLADVSGAGVAILLLYFLHKNIPYFGTDTAS